MNLLNHTLTNEFIAITVAAKGAELQSLRELSTDVNYLWKGDPAFWGKYSPVLFPIVGGLKHNTYYWKEQPYTLGRHGFARDYVFEVEEQFAHQITFLLRSDETTKQVYPFDFELRIRYTLVDHTVQVTYDVKNTGDECMYFSIGAHPAFSVPFTNEDTYTNYRLVFEKEEQSERWPLVEGGLIATSSVPYFSGNNMLPLSKDLFTEDAVVFKNLQSEEIRIQGTKTDKELIFKWNNFPYFGIWAAPQADFVCLEPWCGIADSADTTQQLEEKEGIEKLATGEQFIRSWSVTIR